MVVPYIQICSAADQMELIIITGALSFLGHFPLDKTYMHIYRNVSIVNNNCVTTTMRVDIVVLSLTFKSDSLSGLEHVVSPLPLPCIIIYLM